MQMVKHRFIRKPNQALATIAAAMVFGIVGSLMLFNSRAATSSSSLETEKGSLAGSASVTTNDTTASGGGGVKFGAAASGGVTGSTPGPVAWGAPADWTTAGCPNINGLTGRLFSVTTADPDNGPNARVTVKRCYLLHIPTTLGAKTTANKIPILVNLHGGGGNAHGQANRSDLNTKADSSKFIVIYPYAGAGTPGGGSYGWDSGVGSRAGVELPHDFDFLYGIINDVVNNPSVVNGYTVDAKRAYLVGFSSGSMMTYNVACASDNPFAAVANVSGLMNKTPPGVVFPPTNVDTNNVNYSVPCTPSRPTSLLEIHNMQDPTVKWGGEWHLNNPPNSRQSVPAYPSVFDNIRLYWHSMNSCTGESVQDVTNTYSSPVTLTQYDQTGCASGTDTRLIALATSTSGSQHAFWDSTATDPFYYTTVDDIIWNFLSPYSLP